ncbi:MAG: hypothetical protein H6R27_1560 [Proteobacteria bacterium]|nr:hypothetical protein [Pseudomonadota bacterium]
MRPLADIEARLDALESAGATATDATELLALSEEVLEHWVSARGEAPTADRREGFRLLALHRQGCRDVPSFNACRETCRELVYHYNLLGLETDAAAAARHARMMVLLARHLHLFVAGKMQVEQLGEFCCSSRPLRQEAG